MCSPQRSTSLAVTHQPTAPVPVTNNHPTNATCSTLSLAASTANGSACSSPLQGAHRVAGASQAFLSPNCKSVRFLVCGASSCIKCDEIQLDCNCENSHHDGFAISSRLFTQLSLLLRSRVACPTWQVSSRLCSVPLTRLGLADAENQISLVSLVSGALRKHLIVTR